MHFSKFVACALLVASAGLLIAEASRNYHNNNNNNRYHRQQQQQLHGGYARALAHYGGSSGANYGAAHARPQYHSYAVRPAMYGGHRMYNYQGYARHYPRPSAGYRKQRRGGATRHARRHGNRYNNNNNNHHQQQYRPAPMNLYINNNHHYNSHAQHLPAGYTLKPINALALVPIAHGSQYYNQMVQGANLNAGGYGGQQQRDQYRNNGNGNYNDNLNNHNNYNNNNNLNNNYNNNNNLHNNNYNNQHAAEMAYQAQGAGNGHSAANYGAGHQNGGANY